MGSLVRAQEGELENQPLTGKTAKWLFLFAYDLLHIPIETCLSSIHRTAELEQ